MPRSTETLLLVEDEKSVRHLAHQVLEAQGNTVLRANNGQDALNTVRQYKGTPIRLVVTDVIMPQMGGRVIAEWLKATYPDLKILFASGYTDEAIARHGVLDPLFSGNSRAQSARDAGSCKLIEARNPLPPHPGPLPQGEGDRLEFLIAHAQVPS